MYNILYILGDSVGDVVVVRNVDKDLYRRLKSIAALKGYTIGEALNEAIRLWLSFNEIYDSRFLDYMISREKSRKKISEIISRYSGEEYKGKYAVVCSGEFIGIYDSLDEAMKAAGRQDTIQCTIAELGKTIRRERIELGMGVMD